MKTRFGQVARVGVLIALSTLTASIRSETPTADYVPCRIQQRTSIDFPARMLAEGILHGEVVLLLDVDRNGQLLDVLALAYTQKEFAQSAMRAVKEWRYTPGRVGTDTVGSTIRLNVEFEVAGVMAYVAPLVTERADPTFGERFTYMPLSVARLDRVPAAVARSGPIYPKAWIAQGKAGAVTVEFYIDEEGRVRFPSIVGQADEYLAAAALAALKEWRFEPPRAKGQPALVRARQVFDFNVPLQARKS